MIERIIATTWKLCAREGEAGALSGGNVIAAMAMAPLHAARPGRRNWQPRRRGAAPSE